MRSFIALLNRELIEHKGAFVIAPLVLVALFTLVTLAGLFSGHPTYAVIAVRDPSASHILSVVFLLGFGVWTVYTLVALFFYYADSFSADQRNNALLFWKSMPQSDLKILTSKAVAGITIFPAIIMGFAMLTALVFYVLTILMATRIPLPTVGPVEMIAIWLQACLAGLVNMVLNILWYAPFLGLVAGLSTVVKRWSIPLAILLPLLLTLFEAVFVAGNGGGARPIADYLAYRRDGLIDDEQIFGLIIGGQMESPLVVMNAILAQIDWLQMGYGVVFAAVIVVLASEYRRRRLET